MRTNQRVLVTEPLNVILDPVEVGEPGPGQALLRTEKTLISTGTELTAVTGDFPRVSAWANYLQYPVTLGYSSVAIVEAVGDGVDRVKPGDRVGSFAPHASWAVYPADSLWPIPDAVDSDSASFATLAEIVLGGVRRSGVMLGESVVVIGAGLLGQLAIAFCRIAGAWPLISVDPAAARLPMAKQFGATHTIASGADSAREEVAGITAGRMADLVIEVTGNPVAMAGAVKLARKQGRVALLGSPRGPVTIDLHDEVHTNSLLVIGTHNSAHPSVETPNAPWTIARHVDLFFQWQAAGVVDVRPLITHRYSWREAPEAYAMLVEDRTRALGVVLDWTDGDSGVSAGESPAQTRGVTALYLTRGGAPGGSPA